MTDVHNVMHRYALAIAILLRVVRGLWSSLLLLVPFMAWSCAHGPEPPTTATVEVEAAGDQALTLIVASRFTVTSSGDVYYGNGDTLSVTDGYAERFQLNAEGRFVATLANDSRDAEEVRLSVSIDGRPTYTQGAILADGGFLQFVYRFTDFQIIG